MKNVVRFFCIDTMQKQKKEIKESKKKKRKLSMEIYSE